MAWRRADSDVESSLHKLSGLKIVFTPQFSASRVIFSSSVDTNVQSILEVDRDCLKVHSINGFCKTGYKFFPGSPFEPLLAGIIATTDFLLISNQPLSFFITFFSDSVMIFSEPPSIPSISEILLLSKSMACTSRLDL